MPTEIVSNGSKWLGQAPDSIEALLDVLAKHQLDKSFGRFIWNPPKFLTPGESMDIPGVVHYFGNFADVSHVFDIYTTDETLKTRLNAAILHNLQRQRPKRKENRP